MIAFANFCAADEISGVSTWFEKLVIQCHRHGMPVSVLLHGLGNDAHTSSVYRSLSDAGVPTRYSLKPRFTEDGVKETIRFLNEFRPRVFVPHCFEHFYYAADFATKGGLPWIFTIHSDDPVYWAVAKLLNLKHPLASTVGVSSHVCDLFREHISQSIEQIAYGVSVPNETTGYRRTPFKIAFCGRVVEEQKRISLVIQSMALACQQSSDIECVIIGDGPQCNAMKTHVESIGLSNRIQFLGRLNAMPLRATLLDCQAILLMSDYEGLPVAILEAMSMGVVPVARKITSGIPELIHHEESGLLVNDDPTCAAKELVRLSNNAVLWAACSANARQIVSRDYTDQVCFERWRRLIETRSELCSVTYPLSIPYHVALPAVPSALVGRDVRKITPIDRLRTRFQKFLKRRFA